MSAHVPFAEELDTCLRCGYCRAVCPTWREVGWESASPRGRANWLRRIARQTPLDRALGLGPRVTERFFEHFYYCTMCGMCAEVCHTAIPLHHVWEGCREWLVREGWGPLGPHGEMLTDDYPQDHPHHRGVWWSWPVTRWNDQLADIWAVVGVWSQPHRIKRVETGPVFALLEAECTWKFGKDEKPIVFEEVRIRAFRQDERHRVVDVEVQLTALADGVSIGGRPNAGYGGFALRAAPCTDRKITSLVDPENRQPRRAWVDYSGQFTEGQGSSGVAIFEHVTNPDYPNPIHEYPQCNCVMPAYPDKREVTLSKDEPLLLKHRLWIHPGVPAEQTLANVWASYAHGFSAGTAEK